MQFEDQDVDQPPGPEHPGRLPRAIQTVASGYAAAHGHPLDHDGLVQAHQTRRRWALGTRAALIVMGLLGLFLVVVGFQLLKAPRGTPLTPSTAQTQESLTFHAPLEPSATPEVAQQEAPGKTDHGPVVVHVAGQVNSPGVVHLEAGARVADAVAAAGGLTAQADPNLVNLARVVQDAEQIYVPALGEELQVVPGSELQEEQAQGTPDLAPTGLININTATEAQLQDLPGIGPALAGRIVAWRTQNGPFSGPTDLLSVSGIGPSVMSKIQELITVAPQ